jgi:hypothetical protein
MKLELVSENNFENIISAWVGSIIGDTKKKIILITPKGKENEARQYIFPRNLKLLIVYLLNILLER